MSASLVEHTAALFQSFKQTPVINGPAAPELPDVGPSSYTPLNVKPEHPRKLSSITRLQSLGSTIENYFTKYPNIKKLAPFFQSLTLPLAAPITLRQPELDTLYTDFNPLIISSPNDLITLLHRFLLRSICQILRVLDSFGDTADQDWTFTTIPFTPGDMNVKDAIPNPDPIVLHPRGYSSKPNNVRLVILPFTPWEFSDRDFLHLSFSPTKFNNSSPKWTKYDKVWAYLYDICFDLNCPFFVITSYQQWFFGYFSQDYSTIHFAPLTSPDLSNVSVIQILIYWIQNDFGINQSQIQKRRREEDCPLPEVKRRRVVHAILEEDSTEVWRRIHGHINLGPKFSPGSQTQRRVLELCRTQDQEDHLEKWKRRQKAIFLSRNAKKAEKMKIAREAERSKKVREVMMIEEPPSVKEIREVPQVEEALSVEEVLGVDEIMGEPNIEETKLVEEASRAVGEVQSIEEAREEAVEETDMISTGVNEVTMVEEKEMPMCGKVGDYAHTNGQSEQTKADENMMFEEEASIEMEEVNVTEHDNEHEKSEGPKATEDTVSDDSDSEIDNGDAQSLKACEKWETKVKRFNTKNEFIYFEQPDSSLFMFGDREAYLSDYDEELALDVDALPNCSGKDLKIYYKMEEIERHGWNIFLRRTDYYFPSLAPSIDTKRWSSGHLAHHLFLAEQAWQKRRFAPCQLGPDWNTNLHPVLALHNHRLIVGAGNSLICYKFKPSPSIPETTRVSFERVVAFPKDARKDIVGMEFYNNGNDLILAFVHGGLGRLKLRDSTTKRTFVNLPSLALVKNNTNAPRIKNLSICGDTALTVDSSGSLSLFSLNYSRPEIISTTNPFFSGQDKNKPVVAWSNYFSLTSSTGYAAVGISSSSTVPLSIYPILESTISNQASAHLSPLVSSSGDHLSTAVYAIIGGNNNSFKNQHSYSDQIVISGWFHGVISMHDLRCPSAGNDKILPPVLLLRDPLALSAIYSLSIADHRVTAGSAQHGLLQLYDVRAPRSGFSIYLPTARGVSSPVYSTIMESTRVWAATASCAHAIDFGRTSHNTFPAFPNRRGQVQVPRIKAPMYEHSEHHLSSSM